MWNSIRRTPDLEPEINSDSHWEPDLHCTLIYLTSWHILSTSLLSLICIDRLMGKRVWGGSGEEALLELMIKLKLKRKGLHWANLGQQLSNLVKCISGLGWMPVTKGGLKSTDSLSQLQSKQKLYNVSQWMPHYNPRKERAPFCEARWNFDLGACDLLRARRDAAQICPSATRLANLQNCPNQNRSRGLSVTH